MDVQRTGLKGLLCRNEGKYEPEFLYYSFCNFFAGKRSTVPCLGSRVYRPHLLVKGDTEYLGVCFIDGDLYEFNQAAYAVALPVYDGVNYNKLAVNTPFFIMEGPHITGEGVVKDILPY